MDAPIGNVIFFKKPLGPREEELSWSEEGLKMVAAADIKGQSFFLCIRQHLFSHPHTPK